MLINKKKVKEFALECAKNRYHKFNRVSADFLVHAEGKLKDEIRRHIHALPSVGKTIR